jgi:hypothetical protein
MQKLLHLLRTFFLFVFFIDFGYASVSAPIAIDLNSTVEGVLTSASEASPVTHNAAEDYVFTLTEEKNIVIQLDADFTYIMYLLDSNGSVIDNATKYDETNNKIVISLLPGTYTIDITTMYVSKTGSFSLSLEENSIESKMIDIDTMMDDEWTSISGFSPHSKKHTNYYTFVLSENTNVLIDLQSTAPALYLLDANNTIVDSTANDYIYGTQHAKIVKTLSPGTYTIDATSKGYEERIETYTLHFKTNTIESSDIVLNSVVSDTWSLSSGTSPHSKSYTHYYTFILDEDKNIALEMNTNVNNAKIYLIDSNNTVLAQSSGYYKFIVMHLVAGTYTIDASSNNNHTGNYSLHLRENIIPSMSIAINSSIEGDLNSSSGISNSNGVYLNYHTFTLNEKKDLIVDLPGSNLRFYILDEYGNEVVKNNQYRFSQKLLANFEAGTYTIVVTQYSRENKHYHLSLSENIIKTKNISLNSTVEDVLEDCDGISPYTNAYVKRFKFVLEKQTDVAIDLNMSNPVITNKRIYLLDGNTSNIIADTNYNNFSRIGISLDAGTYFIDVTYDDFQKNKTSSFALTLKENIIETKPIILNKLTHDSWRYRSGVNHNGQYVNRYTFSLAQTANIFITLNADRYKTLILRRNGEFIGEEWRISRNYDLLMSKVLGAGNYTVDVVNADWEDSKDVGDYTLYIQANVAIPQQVKHLAVDSHGAYGVVLTWDKMDESTIGYRIYVDDKLVAEVPADEHSFVINGLQPETTHRYRVVAYNSAGESTPVTGKFTTKKDDYGWMIPIYHLILN